MNIDPEPDLLWRIAAAVGGAIVSLSLPMHQKLSPGGKFANFVNGFLCAIFLGPIVIRRFFPDAAADSEIVGGTHFLVGLTAMALMPFLIEKLRKAADNFSWGKEE